MKIKLLTLISLFLIFGFLFVKVGEAYEEGSKKNKINQWNKQRFEDFYVQPKNSVDLLFLGSSHSYCTFDPKIFDEKLNVSSFQLGMPLQHPDATYLTLKEALNYQSPKTVVMEVYWDLLKDSFEPKQIETLFQVLKNDRIKKDFIKNGFPLNERVKYSIPAIRYQADYFALKSKEISDFFEKELQLILKKTENVGTEKYSDKGFIYCDYIINEDELDKTNQFNSYDGRLWEFNKTQKEYLNKIVELCREENISLIFVTAPIANISLEKIKGYSLINKAIADFAKEKDIPYLDFNMVNVEEGLFENNNFRDYAHLNYSGAVIACDYFIKKFFSIKSS